jgi:FKBP-type peptidyl-prolyl cis-trans isomerase 2
MNIPVIKMLTEMNIGQLNDTKAMIDSLIKSKVRNEMKVGMKVYVVQKTKKTPGVITKINQSKCVVDMLGRSYRVPMSMLEAA